MNGSDVTMSSLVQLVDRGLPVAQLPAGTFLLGFVVWGALMAVAGALLTWVLLGHDRTGDGEHYEPRPFRIGKIGVPTYDANATTVVVRRPQRIIDEIDSYVGRAGCHDVPGLRIVDPPASAPAGSPAVPQPRRAA